MSEIERVEMEPGFLLHARAYRETSQIVEVLSQNHGRVGLVARGARRNKSKWRSALRPFQPLRMSWSGRGSLFTLRAAEPTTGAIQVAGMSLMAAFYFNELLLTFVQRGDSHPALFVHYGAALASLAAGNNIEAVLRRFEVSLLAEIGYGLVVERDVVDAEPLDKGRRYEYVIDRGPVPVSDNQDGEFIFSGSELLAIASGDFHNAGHLKRAKRLLRAILDHYLAGRPLKTRRVLASMRR